MTSLIDLRSDTVTKPTEAMRAAMMRAEVGDDVYGEDPTVHALEERVAALLGKEASLFVTSGTMGNQLAIACQTRPGDEIVVGEGAHPMFYESGAAAALSGVQFAVAGTGGLFTAEEAASALKPRAYYCPRTSMISVENTHNRAGGRVFPGAEVARIAEVAKRNGLAFHLDGARLWNASVASGASVAALAEPFHTVSLCFSKGLGAPVGSALAGPRDLVVAARRFRKMWGGGMRQSGILAAAALYAMDHHVVRLEDDHARAKRLAARLAHGGVSVVPPETNIVLFDVSADAAVVAERARAQGVAVNATDPRRLRAVTHLGISDADIDTAADRLLAILKELA